MIKKRILILVSSFGLTTSSLLADVANISYGSAVEIGGAMFLGEDGGAASSVSIGYFNSNVFSADLAGWNFLNTLGSSPLNGFFSTTTANTDTTAASGFDAYLLITDTSNTGDSLSGFVSLDSWGNISGTNSPAQPEQLVFLVGASETSASVTAIAGLGTAITITDGQGTNFAGGFSGTGVSIGLSAVPEPSAYAALAGFIALTAVIVRRRRA